MFDYDQCRICVEHLLEDICCSEEENSKLNAWEKRWIWKRKMDNVPERYQTFLIKMKDVDFACMDVTDIDSDDSTSEISNGAMQ